MSESPHSVVLRSISGATAMKLVEALIFEASKSGLTVAVAVVDVSGNLRAFCAMDGCAALPIKVAQDKARSAILARVDTKELAEVARTDADLGSILSAQPNIALIAGGVILSENDEVIGALGVSGASVAEDSRLAELARQLISPHKG